MQQMQSPSSKLSHCPGATQLQAFYAAALPHTDMDAIEAHVAQCNKCLEALDDYDDISDTIVQVLSMLPANRDDEQGYSDLRRELLQSPEPLTHDPTQTLTAPVDSPSGNDYPKRIGAYELLELIGQGASGAVFRARHLKLDRIVAIKLLNSRHHLRDTQTLVRFQHEMRAVGRLDHPHIVRATDAGDEAGRHYLVMEYVEGVDVSLLLRLNGPLRVADACELIRQAALGLECAHQHRMVHRDVKPSNLFLTLTGQVKLLDLGLASFEGQSDPSEESDLPFGTGDYMSPEQWTNFHGVDGRADLYSLGCTLFKLLGGRAVFVTSRRDYLAKMNAHCTVSVPSIRELRPEVPLGLQKILNRMLAKRPEDRYETASEVAQRLAPFAADARLESLVASVVPLRDEHRGRTRANVAPDENRQHRSRRRLLQMAAGALVAAIPLATVVALSRRRDVQTLRPNMWRDVAPTGPIVYFPASTDQPLTGRSLESESKERSSVRIDATHAPAILEMGRPVRGHFRLRASIQCEPTGTRAGLFFQYRPRKTRSGLTHPMQCIELTEQADRIELYWGRYRFIARDQGGYELDRFDWGTTEVMSTENVSASRRRTEGDSADHQLEIVLGNPGVPLVRWNEQLISPNNWKLTEHGWHARPQTATELEQQYLGRFGLLVRTGIATFSNVQLAYLN